MTISREIIDAVNNGDVAIVATDTVYGLLARPDTKGHARIFELKERPKDKPLPCLIASTDHLSQFAKESPSYARRLAEMFWPGALTLVLNASDEARAQGCASDDGTIALRCPDDESLLELLDASDSALVCTSANIHGQVTPCLARDLPREMLELPGASALPEMCEYDGASTIVDCTGAYPVILRHGPIPEQVILDVACFGARLDSSEQ